MEPRFFKRGNVPLALVETLPNIVGFNGATFFQTWKCYSDDSGRVSKLSASMEPRFFKRGNVACTKSDPPPPLRASMEPRFFKRGNSMKPLAKQPRRLCFNGATFFQTWKSRPPHHRDRHADNSFNGATFFQTWKFRVLLSAFSAVPELQWSHVFSNVEISTANQRWKSGFQRFNGATFFQTWK